MSQAFRCSASSLARSEPLSGTASTVRTFLLVEVAGPWGVNALRGNRLLAEGTSALTGRTGLLGIRVLLIRRHGRSRQDGITVFAASADPHHPWMETTRLESPSELPGLDLEALVRGSTLGLAPTSEPVFLVCTHGRHDACCAERGRPVAAALSAAQTGRSWEVSHIGGDRFAANLLVLPDGLYYGRVDASGAPALATRHLSGHLDLDHLRGRSGYAFAVQAAEIFLRRELGLTAVRALRLASQTSRHGIVEAVFAMGDQRWMVRVRRDAGPAERLTCDAELANPIPVHTLEMIEPLDVPPSQPAGGGGSR